MFAAKYQLKRVTAAILNCAFIRSTVYAALMNSKGKSLIKQCFYRNNKMFSGIDSYNNTCSNAVFRHWHWPTVTAPAPAEGAGGLAPVGNSAPPPQPGSIKLYCKKRQWRSDDGTVHITSCRTHNSRERLCNNNRAPHSYLLNSTQLNVNLRTQVKHLIVRIYLSKLNTKLYVTYYSYWSISNSG